MYDTKDIEEGTIIILEGLLAILKTAKKIRTLLARKKTGRPEY